VGTEEQDASAVEAPPPESERKPRSAGALPAVIGGKYRPLRLIAKGGMGAVYEVVHANTGQHLALKLMLARSLLAPDLVERFRREARIHGAVKSDHVVRVVDADVASELDDAPFLVMELLDGRDLERLCAERSPAPAEVLDWLRQLAPALDKAHQEGIVHRDLKPENIFLAEREGLPPIIKILDFGIAKMDGEAVGNATATGQILGTPRYMAPEQAHGAKQVTAAADRFALGLIAFRLLAGRHYFPGDNWVALLRQVARGPQARPSAMGFDRGSAFDAWFARACAVRPEDRFATAVEEVEALAAAIAARPSRRRVRARTWVAVAGAGALVASIWAVARPRTAAAPPASPRPAPVTTLAAPPSPPPPALQVAPPDPPWADSSTSRPDPGQRSRRRKRVETKAGQPPVQLRAANDGAWDEP
jgi:serine/threonine-protein kinase